MSPGEIAIARHPVPVGLRTVARSSPEGTVRTGSTYGL